MNIEQYKSEKDCANKPIFTTEVRRIIIFGNCQAENLFHVLRSVESFALSFEFSYHFVRTEEGQLAQLEAEAASADIWFVQDVADWDAYPIRRLVRADAIIVRFPFLYMAALWPFDSFQYGPDAQALALGEVLGPARTFDFQDGLMARLREIKPDASARLLAYYELQTVNTTHLHRLLEVDTARLRRMDRAFGFGLGEFILSTFASRRTFHSITHPTTELLKRLADALMERFGHSIIWPETEDFDRLSVYQVPIHPKVIDQLGLEWANSSTLYNFKGSKSLSFEEYFQKYIEVYG